MSSMTAALKELIRKPRPPLMALPPGVAVAAGAALPRISFWLMSGHFPLAVPAQVPAHG